ncbi:MAG: hypothetical protein ABI678_18825 [Kofleriaceae bacterium]
MAYVGWHTHEAQAKGGDDSGDEGDDDGGDDGGGGKEKEGSDDCEDDSCGDGDGSDPPPLTAGGLFTINTYPVRENSRPLTMTKGITQLRLALGTDLSSKGAFASFGLNAEAQYGYADNFTLIGGITDAYNFQQFGFYAGFEGALAYDLLDIRLALNVHRTAIPAVHSDLDDPNSKLVPGYGNFCDPPVMPNEQITPTHGTCDNPMATVDPLPSGDYVGSNLKFSIDLGFPFRYAIRPEVAIVALQTLMSIDFNAVSVDHIELQSMKDDVTGLTTTRAVARGNSAKPDLNPSIGIATNPIPQLSVTIFAQLRVPDFDLAAGNFQIPVTGRIEASPNQKLDFGLEFTLLNVKPLEPQTPFDNRFLSLFMQARY